MFNWWFILVGIPFVEIIGYLFHKFLDHGHFIKKVEYEHWKHHFKFYPPDNLRPDHPYVKVNAIEWKVAAPLLTILVLLFVPFRFSLPLVIGGITYGAVLWCFHRLFHLRKHFLSKNKYFLYLRKIHDVHHLDTEKNFTIAVPLLDMMHGTYAGKVNNRRNTFSDFEERYKRELKTKAVHG